LLGRRTRPHHPIFVYIIYGVSLHFLWEIRISYRVHNKS
jgi:hypothetical protein